MEDRKLYRVFWMDGSPTDVLMSEDEAREFEYYLTVSSVRELEGGKHEGNQEEH
ncbi:hypothetical protein PbDSM24746_62960 [Paenibacillus macerans]|nr:hypothetical protein PbDSM24746_62960 [Paenibacillus macerans]